MINGKTILAIIPARGGSKGLPGKNIKTLAGKPLIGWTIEEAKKSKYIDRLIVSSDDDEIISVAKNFDVEIPFKRPAELAKDNSSSSEVVIHALKKINNSYDYFILLQPTSPLRKSEHIDEAIELCYNSNSTSCVAITEISKPLEWMYNLDNSNYLLPLINNKIQRRQDAKKIFALNGSIYIVRTNEFIESNKFMTERTVGYLMDKKSSTDIDDITDFNIAEYLLLKQIKENES